MAAKPSLNRMEMMSGSTAITTTVAATSACSQDKLGKFYSEFIAAMWHEDGSGGTADRVDIPKEMARVIVVPAGKWPLPSAVHPSFRPQEKINQVSRMTRLELAKLTRFGL